MAPACRQLNRRGRWVHCTAALTCRLALKRQHHHEVIQQLLPASAERLHFLLHKSNEADGCMRSTS